MTAYRNVSLGVLTAVAAFASTAWAEQVTVSGDTVYVTRNDCAVLATYRPDPGVTYQPGKDVHGKYVAPADISGGEIPGLVPGRVGFNVVVNPMNYGAHVIAGREAAASAQAVVGNSQSIQQAEAQKPVLAAQLTAQQAKLAQLSAQKQAIDTDIANRTAQIIASTGGATPDAAQRQSRTVQLNALADQTTATDSYRQLQSDTLASGYAVQATQAAITRNDQALTTAQGQAQPLQDRLTTAQGQAAGLQGKYDNTQLPVAHVDVDLRTGETYVNGHALTSEQDRIVRDACRKAGYR